jgi:hypothetical protein
VNPKSKIRALAFGLILPYFALVMFFVFRIQKHPLPSWFPYFGLSYILGTIIAVTVYNRRISRGAQPETVNEPQSARRWMLWALAGYLIAVWSGFFLWGTVETIRGNFEWKRALPAGAFLLAFIALFSRFLYSDIKRRTQSAAPINAKITDKG